MPEQPTNTPTAPATDESAARKLSNFDILGLANMAPAPAAPAPAEAPVETEDEDHSDQALEPAVETPTDEAPDNESDEDAPAADEPKGPAGVQKRIDKLTAQKTELKTKAEQAEARAAELERQLAELQSRPAAVVQATPLDSVQDVRQLAAAEANLEKLREWAFQNQDGGELPAELNALDQGGDPSKAEPIYISAEHARKMYLNTDAMIRREIPARREAIQIATQTRAALRQHYAPAFDTSTPEGQEFAAIRRDLAQRAPAIAAQPNADVITLALVKGMAALKAEEAARTKPKPKASTPPAPAPVAPPSAPRVPVGAIKTKSALRPGMTAEEMAEARSQAA